MTKAQAEKLVKQLEDQGYEATIRGDYSGRFMYGETTYAVVTDHNCSLTKKYRVDSMGLGIVVY